MLFERIVNSWKLLTIFAKSAILIAPLVSECTSADKNHNTESLAFNKNGGVINFKIATGTL